MSKKINLTSLFIVLIILSSLPFTTSAFWWFNKTETPVVQKEVVSEPLTDNQKTEASDKYKLWQDSFEQKNIESVITNRNKFIFSIPELNYISEVESQKVKNPSIKDIVLSRDQDNIKVSADLHKFINGHFSFDAKIISVENKIHLALSSVSFYGIPIPVKWLETPANKALDDYFSFLYKDTRYTGFSFIDQNNYLQIKPEFSK